MKMWPQQESVGLGKQMLDFVTQEELFGLGRARQFYRSDQTLKAGKRHTRAAMTASSHIPSQRGHRLLLGGTLRTADFKPQSWAACSLHNTQDSEVQYTLPTLPVLWTSKPIFQPTVREIYLNMANFHMFYLFWKQSREL